MPFRPDGPSFAGDHSWWTSGGWHIVPLIVFVILIGVIVWAVLRLTAKDQGSDGLVAGRADGALEEVRVRYARGEMTRAEFVQRFRDLGGSGVPDQPLASAAPPDRAADPSPPTEPTPPAT